MNIHAVIIGTAHMHVNEIAQYIFEQPNTVLCGVADVPPELPEHTEKRYTRAWNLKNITENYDAAAYDDYKVMLDTIKPDVAYLLCENTKKEAVAEEVARRGIDVIIEKPMTVSAESAARIIALKEKYGVQVFVNWPVAWRKDVRELKLAIDSGLCGEVQRIRYLNGHTGPLGKGAKHRGVASAAEEMTDEERSRIWWYKQECGGGAYLDILCYGCWYARWLFGKLPIDVMAVGANLNTPYGNVEDNVAALLRYERGFAVAEGTWTTPRVKMPAGPEVVCRNGVVWSDGIPDGKSVAAAVNESGERVTVPALPEGAMCKNMPWQYAAFRNEGRPMFEPLTAEFNADVVAMIEAARRSGESRCAEAPRPVE